MAGFVGRVVSSGHGVATGKLAGKIVERMSPIVASRSSTTDWILPRNFSIVGPIHHTRQRRAARGHPQEDPVIQFATDAITFDENRVVKLREFKILLCLYLARHVLDSVDDVDQVPIVVQDGRVDWSPVSDFESATLLIWSSDVIVLIGHRVRL